MSARCSAVGLVLRRLASIHAPFKDFPDNEQFGPDDCASRYRVQQVRDDREEQKPCELEDGGQVMHWPSYA
jgi:hypothetical protein